MNMKSKHRYIAPKVERLYLSSMNLLQSASIDYEIYGDIEDINYQDPE